MRSYEVSAQSMSSSGSMGSPSSRTEQTTTVATTSASDDFLGRPYLSLTSPTLLKSSLFLKVWVLPPLQQFWLAPFMSDEAMEVALGNSKDYSLKRYLLFITKLQEKAKELKLKGEWGGPSDVERALWSCTLRSKSKDKKPAEKSSSGKKRKRQGVTTKEETDEAECGGGSSCDAAFTRWFVAVEETGGKRREIELVVGGGEDEDEERRRRSRQRHVFEVLI
ncbi:unnamed protein product [Eruca vesicaria subsp. sativa]|uniref:Uncharacterized protein n=1 Tax=Eruca vesicaria subsp. sativa TaxID=29727 RepID=A0ABC8K238_ERUVS|nr:unnamed protein product [Eruca vesicaria subsp. sativa]